jgi:hypothetical protein
MRVYATNVVAEKQYVLRILSCGCSLWYPAHAPNCQLLSIPLYSTFPPFLMNGNILKKVIEHKMFVSSFSKTFV